MEWSFVLRAFLIGIVVALPVGPVGLMTIRNSVTQGRRAALSGALGGVTVDALCALVVTFALSSLRSFVENHETMICLVGGILLIAFGLGVSLTHLDERKREWTSSLGAGNYVKGFAAAASNPGCLAVMFVLFTSFRMDMGECSTLIKSLSIIALFLGSALYWSVVTYFLSRFGEGLQMKYLRAVNRIAGIGIAVFGLFLLCKIFF